METRISETWFEWFFINSSILDILTIPGVNLAWTSDSALFYLKCLFDLMILDLIDVFSILGTELLSSFLKGSATALARRFLLVSSGFLNFSSIFSSSNGRLSILFEAWSSPFNDANLEDPFLFVPLFEVSFLYSLVLDNYIFTLLRLFKVVMLRPLVEESMSMCEGCLFEGVFSSLFPLVWLITFSGITFF